MSAAKTDTRVYMRGEAQVTMRLLRRSESTRLL